jgi:hypothetical protein
VKPSPFSAAESHPRRVAAPHETRISVLDPGRSSAESSDPFRSQDHCGIIGKTYLRSTTLGRTLVLLVGMQGILGEIIKETLAAETDMEVVGELTDLRHLAATTDFALPDAVIAFLGHGSASSRSLRRLLRQQRHTKLLIVSEDGRWAALYGEAGVRIPIDDPIPSTLVDAIRGPAPLSVSRA